MSATLLRIQGMSRRPRRDEAETPPAERGQTEAAAGFGLRPGAEHHRQHDQHEHGEDIFHHQPADGDPAGGAMKHAMIRKNADQNYGACDRKRESEDDAGGPTPAEGVKHERSQGGIVAAVLCASTVVLVRVLADKGELHSSIGRIAVGWLVVEDIFTVFVLVLLPVIFGAADRRHRSLPLAIGMAALNWQRRSVSLSLPAATLPLDPRRHPARANSSL